MRMIAALAVIHLAVAVAVVGMVAEEPTAMVASAAVDPAAAAIPGIPAILDESEIPDSVAEMIETPIAVVVILVTIVVAAAVEVAAVVVMNRPTVYVHWIA